MKKLKNLTDEAVVELVWKEDQELYREIVRRYQAKLLRYATYLIRDEAKAADVVQDSFIKSFVNLKGFNLKKKFSSWIYRIVHNEAINYLKKHRREVPLDSHQWLKSQEDVEADLSRKEARRMLYQSLRKLPLKYRSPLVLFYLEEKSYEEISDVLRIPIGTVGTRINRGKKMIRLIYQAKGGETHAQN